MSKLTAQMREVLNSIFELQTLDSFNKKTIQSLINRGLITNGQLSDEGKIAVLANMKLSKQCSELSLELTNLQLNYQTKPELAALHYFEELGYVGSMHEGNFMLTILKALMLDKLEKYNFFQDRKDARVSALSSQFANNQEHLDEIISSIRITNRENFISNIREITYEPLVQEFYPGLSADVAIIFFDAIDLSIFEKIAIKFAEDPYEYRKGWPDLTIIKDGKIRLIEIKTTDKLHESQLKMIPILRDILPFEISVCKIN